MGLHLSLHTVLGGASHSVTKLEGERRFELGRLAGRFVELSGWAASAGLSVAMQLVHAAQLEGRNTVWVSTATSHPFYAPDAARGGVDLAALPVVMAGDAQQAGRAVSHLLRSGAFALLVLDMVPEAERTGGEVDLPLPLQSRIAGLAQKHGTALVVLTAKPPESASLGSLVSLHVHAQRVRRVARERDVETKPRLRLVGRGGQGGDEDKALPSGEVGFEVVLSVEKDKRQGPGWNQVEVFRGPTGIG
jgi:hypothetical protein